MDASPVPASDTDQIEQTLERIRNALDGGASAYLDHTDPLQPADFKLMGLLIQNYCYADLNARRVIDAIRHAALGPDQRNAGALQDKQVFEELRKAVARLPASPLKDGLDKAGETIAMHLQMRHIFAHWAGRRVRSHDALVLFTKNSREAEKKSGLSPSPEHLVWVVVPLAPLRIEIEKLEGHGRYMASSAAHIEAKHDEWKSHFDRIKEEERLAKYQAGKIKKGTRGASPSPRDSGTVAPDRA